MEAFLVRSAAKSLIAATVRSATTDVVAHGAERARRGPGARADLRLVAKRNGFSPRPRGLDSLSMWSPRTSSMTISSACTSSSGPTIDLPSLDRQLQELGDLTQVCLRGYDLLHRSRSAPCGFARPVPGERRWPYSDCGA
jgi:hypothetical protein